MAIVTMKRLRLMTVREQKNALMRELERFGWVEVSEPDAELEEKGLSRESGDVSSLKSTQNLIGNAIALLDRYAPQKTPLLSSKPPVEAETLLDDVQLQQASDEARRITALEDQMKLLTTEENRQKSLIESVSPWLDLDLPLGTQGTETCALLWGSLPARVSLESVSAAVEAVTDEAEVFEVSADRSSRAVLVVCLRNAAAEVLECLRPFAFTSISFPEEGRTAKETAVKAEKRLKVLADEKESVRQKIVEQADARDGLKLAADIAAAAIARAEAETQMMGLRSTVVLQGWVPAEKEAELAKVLDRFDCAWETEDPSPEEYPDVPVKLKNNRFSDALNMVTNMYSLPAYGSVDPNPVMAPFFILFYGLMMADMGYGLIMMAAALVAMSKMKPRGGTLSFCRLLLYGGISTFIMGALTGGFFGNAPEIIAGMFGSEWKGLPALFSPVRDSNMVLYGAMVLGLLHLNTGMVVNFVKRTKRGDLTGAIFEEGSQWIILLGGVLLLLNMLVWKSAAFLRTAGIAVIVVGVVMLLYGSTRGASGFGKVTAPFGCIYNTLTGWFGDVLSYSRIMALMLAGGVVAQVFNTIAAMPSANGVTVFSGIVFLVIFLIGHALNFALNLLGCFVHDLRLQCLEFFGKFYEDGGKPFSPLSFKTRYYQTEQ